MTREKCISHKARQSIAIVRQDYYELMGRDCVAAAIMNLLEHWADQAIEQGESGDSIYLGRKSIREFQDSLFGISTDKQIRTRLKLIRDLEFADIVFDTRGLPAAYTFHVNKVQEAINSVKIGQKTSVKKPRSNDLTNLGRSTEPPRSNDRTTSVDQPPEPRSNDHPSIYKRSLNRDVESVRGTEGVRTQEFEADFPEEVDGWGELKNSALNSDRQSEADIPPDEGSVLDGELLDEPEPAVQGKIVPLFSDQRKESRMDAIAIVMQLRPDPSTSDYRMLHSTIKQELRLDLLKFYPWNRDERTLRLFYEFLVNSMGKKLPEAQRRSIAEIWLRKANQCVPINTKPDYSKVLMQWGNFIENASTARSHDELAGRKSTLPTQLQEVLARRGLA